MTDEHRDMCVRRDKAIRRSRNRCKLSDMGTLNLEEILCSFNTEIGQEQAWAVCHQTAKFWSECAPNQLFELTSLKQILLHENGTIVLDPLDDLGSVPEKKAVFSMALMIYQALDFGLDGSEERFLPIDLNNLLHLMINVSDDYKSDSLQETDDEGIGRDSEVELDDHENGSFSVNQEDYSIFKHIMHICARHIQGTEDKADAHYRAVIKAYVHEALELNQFLEKVETERIQANLRNLPGSERYGAVSSQHLDTIDFDDWARFWVQVISELRNGTKLKKVEENLKKKGKVKDRGAEFELTPYEILMDDIRERRYKLRKTAGPVRNTRKDARAVILDFIRSRPPLKKASERQLPPRKKESTIRELLMESIKKPPRPLRSCRERQLKEQQQQQQQRQQFLVGGESRRIVLGEVPPVQAAQEQEQEPAQDVAAQWRQTDQCQSNIPPVPRPRRSARNRKSHRRRVRGSEIPGDHSTTDSASKTSQKKLIPVDFDLKLDGEEDEDDDDDPDDVYAVTRFEDDKESNPDDGCSHQDYDEENSANPWRKTGGLRLTRNEYHRFCDAQLESYDLATQCPTRRASVRKHRGPRNNTASFIPFGTCSVPHSRPQSRHDVVKMSPGASPSMSPRPRERTLIKSHTTAEPVTPPNQEKKASIGDMLLDERLSLTLEEIVHIRSVLTKAELESLPVEGRVKEDVEKRRVCFLCLKTRFGILGPWGQRCRLCERTVCVKCYSKMRIPTEHFAHVPVVLLSPGLLISPTESEKNPWGRPGGASAPASPAHRRRDTLNSATPLSTPNPATPADGLTPKDDITDKIKYPKVGGSPSRMTSSALGSLGPTNEQRLAADRMRGVSMVVCHDCRIMVIQIIKSSRSTRATIRNNVISRLTLNLSPAYV